MHRLTCPFGGKSPSLLCTRQPGVQQVLFIVKKQKSCGSSARSFSKTVPWYNYEARFIQGHFSWGFSWANMKVSGCYTRTMAWSLRSGWAAPGIDCEDRWCFCAELEPELSLSYMEDFSPSSQVCTSVLTQLFAAWEDACLVAWGRSYCYCWLGAQLGEVEILSWLMLPRCGCLRISQQSFLLLLEASPNIVPLGATRGLLPPSDSGAKTMDYFLILLGLVCFIEWLPAWVRKLCFLLPIPCWGLVKNWSVCGAGISGYPLACSVSGNTFSYL